LGNKDPLFESSYSDLFGRSNSSSGISMFGGHSLRKNNLLSDLGFPKLENNLSNSGDVPPEP